MRINLRQFSVIKPIKNLFALGIANKKEKCEFEEGGFCTALACYSDKKCRARDKDGNPKYIGMRKIEREYDKGYSRGFEEGREDNYEKGYARGFEKGKENGYEKGYTQGYKDRGNKIVSYEEAK